jgi:hypothetical protein
MKALAKDKDQRYASAEAFGDAIQRYMHQRGIQAAPADIAAFFEKVFAQEIDEHAGRMRELIAGREFASGGSTGVNWDAEGSEKSEIALGAEDMSEISEASQSNLVEEPEGEREEGAEKTRIEMNPLEKVLAAEAARKAGGAGPPSNGKPAVPLPAPPTGPMRPAPSSKELPTVMLEPQLQARSFAEAKTQLGGSPELAPTALGGGPIAPAYGMESTDAAPPLIPDSGDLIATKDGRPPAGSMPPPPGEIAMPSGPYGLAGTHSFPPPMGPMGQPMMGHPGMPPPHMMGPGGYPLQANLMSPAPGGYYGNQDLHQLAAQPIKRVPPWLLALMCSGALLVTFLIVFAVARACR